MNKIKVLKKSQYMLRKFWLYGNLYLIWYVESDLAQNLLVLPNLFKIRDLDDIVYHFYLLLRNWDCEKVPSITHAHHHLQCWFGPTPHCRKSYKQRGRLWIWCPEQWVWKFGGKGHSWSHKGKMVLNLLQ